MSSSPSRALRLYPGPVEEVDAGGIHGDLSFPRFGGFRGMPYVSINMVSTLDGRASIGGRASPIGSGVDSLIMRNIRCAVDAVVVGAGTARAEEMNLGVPDALSAKRKANGLSGQPVAVILAGTRELPLERKIFQTGLRRPVIIAGAATPEDTISEARALGMSILLAEGPGLPDPEQALGLLKEHLGVGTVLLEGGPAVNGAFLASGKVDELFLTLSPKISLSRDEAPSISTPPLEGEAPDTTDFKLASVHSAPQEGELYLRYRRNPHQRPGTPPDPAPD